MVEPTESGRRLCRRSGQAGEGVWSSLGGPAVSFIPFKYVSSWSALKLLHIHAHVDGDPMARRGGGLLGFHCLSGNIRLKREGRKGRDNWALFPKSQSWHQALLKEAQTKALFPSWPCPLRPFYGKEFWKKPVRFIFTILNMCMCALVVGDILESIYFLAASCIVFH